MSVKRSGIGKYQPSYARPCAGLTSGGTVELNLFQCASGVDARRMLSFGTGFLVQGTVAALLMLIGFVFTPELSRIVQKPQFVYLQLSPAVPHAPMPKLHAVKPLPR